MTVIDTQVNQDSLTLDNAELALTTSGWFQDPMGQHHKRYFDGSEWTSHVTHRGPTPCQGCAAS